MAIYHFSAKIVTRGTGRSACAASAYMSCSRIYNDYDGIQHDYTRKCGLVWEHVFLPPQAPAEWQDREKLWNAVEEIEKTKGSRLAREFIAALPVELDKDGWKSLLTEFIENQFVADGMCADVAIHNTDGHNPHAHILLTVRPLNEDGTWQHKTEKEYFSVRNGEERGFTAVEFKTAQNDGWEKQYQYKNGKKKVYLPSSQAGDLERVSKYPKSSKFGRQNPISERWNSEEQLSAWREAWADAVNRQIEQTGSQERIDHRSFADRGIDEQPTIHEGVAARIMEKKGFVSERCEINRQIREDNRILRMLKEMVRKLTEAAKSTIPTIAHAMETARQNMILLCFNLGVARSKRLDAEWDIEQERDAIRRKEEAKNECAELTEQIRTKTEELRTLKSEIEALPFYAVFKRRELTDRIAALTEEIEKLRENEAAKTALLDNIRVHGAEYIERKETELLACNHEVSAITDSINAEKQSFDNSKASVSDEDQNDLLKARFDTRLTLKEATRQRFKEIYNCDMTDDNFRYGAETADKLLGETGLSARFNAKYTQMERERTQAALREKYGISKRNRKAQEQDVEM